MDENDWREMVQIIQEELRKIGHFEIADLSHYETRNGAERFLPHPRELVKEMLDALQRDMSVRSSTTVEESLRQLGQLIDDGVHPTQAVVWVDQERPVVEGRESRQPLEGIENVPKAVEDLKQLMGQLAEIGLGGDLQ